VGLVRRACGIGDEQRCHGSFRCGLAARTSCAAPPPPPPRAEGAPSTDSSTPAAAGEEEEAQDVVVMGRLFVFDCALCFRATHPYALVRAPFLPRCYKFSLGDDVVAVLPCAVASAPNAALALCLRPSAAAAAAVAAGGGGGVASASAAAAAASAGPLPCAVLQEFSSYDEDDNRFFRNAAWEQCFERLLDAAAERAAEAEASKPAAAAAAACPVALASEE
jgi:hypothetical protein